MQHFEEFLQNKDKLYFEVVTTSRKEMNNLIKEVEAEIETTDVQEDLQMMEDEISMYQAMLLSIQNQEFFMEADTPSKVLGEKLKESFSEAELNTICQMINSPLYAKFVEVLHKEEESYSEMIIDNTEKYMLNSSNTKQN